MADGPAQPNGCRKAIGCLAVPCAVALVILFVPPQLSRLTSGYLRPLQGVALYGRANGWDELAALGARIRPAGPGEDSLALNAALLPEIDAAMARPAFVCPSYAWYAAHGYATYEAVAAALDLSAAAAARDAVEGRVTAAVQRWRAQLRAARAMYDNPEATANVALGFAREMAVCERVRATLSQLPGPMHAPDWQPLRDVLQAGPETPRLVAAWRWAHYHFLFVHEFEPETLPASARRGGAAAWLDRLPPNCFDDPWHSLAGYRSAMRRVGREAAKPRPERDLERLRQSLEPQGIYNYRGRWIPAEAMKGYREGFDGEEEVVAWRRLTDLTIALRLAYDRDRRLPPSLLELVKAGLLEEVPEDPFQAWPPRYDPERRLLWSAGADEGDDGGQRGKDLVVALEFAE
jgi:hypothetical protein